MKVSKNWLNEYVAVNELSGEQLGDKIEMTAVEVAGVTKASAGLKKIVVGHVLEVKNHPDADHLHICQIDVGEEAPYQIVCGAPNIAEGQNVIVALPSARIAGNVKIKKAKMRGVESRGMVCALQEIGFPEKVVPKEFTNGIYVLPKEAKPGDDVYDYLGMNDEMIELDITPNRGDMLSMRGTAYEVAAFLDKKVTLPHPTLTESKTPAKASLAARAATDLASTYLLRKLENVVVKPSPQWLQNRLMNAGIRPINNVVDATNYVLLDYGQPLHAFDANKLASDQIEVKLAQKGQELTTLDGEKRTLSDHDMIISDGKNPIALAGVMGGLTSEVDAKTTTVILEAANFNSHYIRKTARKHNLHTDASMRFERGINQATIKEALDAAAELIAKLSGATILAGVVVGSETNVSSKHVAITLDRINHVLGTNLTQADCTKIFEQLGFGVVADSQKMTVEIPPRRWDISIAADLVEEIARIYGYNNLPTTLPAGQMTPGHYTPFQEKMRAARHLLEEAGLSQAISYGLTTEQKAKRFAFDENAQVMPLLFPMTSERTTARMNLLSGLLDDLAYNVARKVEDVKLYEQGRVFFGSDINERPKEVEHIAGILHGNNNAASWHQAARLVDFYDAKGVVEHMLQGLGVLGDVSYVAAADHEEMHPGRCADVYLGDEKVGLVGELHPQLAAELKVGQTYVFELDLTKIINHQVTPIVYQPISKFPTVSRDIALLVESQVDNATITQAIKQKGGKNLKDVKLFDVYAGKNIAAGFKSLAYTLYFANANKTLTDDEVNHAFDNVVAYLTDNYHVKIR